MTTTTLAAEFSGRVRGSHADDRDPTGDSHRNTPESAARPPWMVSAEHRPPKR